MTGERLQGNTLYEVKRFPRGHVPPFSVLSYFHGENEIARKNRGNFEEYWRPHTEASRNAIRESMAGVSGDALILGLGNGLELPLAEMVTQFDSVTAVDIDETGARITLEGLPPELQEKVTLVIDDMSGTIAHADTALRAIIDASRSYREYEQKAAEVIADIPSSPISFPKSFAFASSSLITSQLAALIILQKEDEARSQFPPTLYTSPRIQSYQEAISDLTDRLQREHMQMLGESVQKNGTLYFADTIFRQFITRYPGSQAVGKTGEKLRLINGPTVVHELEKAFAPVSEKGWFWYRKPPPYATYAPTTGDGFEVLSVTSKRK